MRTFLSFAALQFLAFMLLVTNLRAVSELNYLMAGLTEPAYLFLQWTVLKRIIPAEGWDAKLGFMTGGTMATLVAMWLTRGW